MSEKNIGVFLEKAKLDPELLEKISAIQPGPGRSGELAKLSSDADIPVSSEEWEAFLSKAAGELSDSELGSLAGGGIFDFLSIPEFKIQNE